MHRAKFRLRTYTRNPAESCPVFIEIKGRHNQLVFKKRAIVGNCLELGMKKGKPFMVEKISAHRQEQIFKQFEYQYFRKNIRPVVLIDYVRRPYVSRFSRDFRITFDDSLSAIVTRSLFPVDSEPRRSILQGHTIMEVKFRSAIPRWFHHAILNYQLERVSVSKVCRGMDSWNMT